EGRLYRSDHHVWGPRSRRWLPPATQSDRDHRLLLHLWRKPGWVEFPGRQRHQDHRQPLLHPVFPRVWAVRSRHRIRRRSTWERVARQRLARVWRTSPGECLMSQEILVLAGKPREGDRSRRRALITRAASQVPFRSSHEVLETPCAAIALVQTAPAGGSS